MTIKLSSPENRDVFPDSFYSVEPPEVENYEFSFGNNKEQDSANTDAQKNQMLHEFLKKQK